ncbi:hypothetical protein XENTR_v10011041 [Xenopus tropicalis]|nr:hypothetical protein XENTR_v10011041 [Xenopus tropicalis]
MSQKKDNAVGSVYLWHVSCTIRTTPPQLLSLVRPTLQKMTSALPIVVHQTIK